MPDPELARGTDAVPQRRRGLLPRSLGWFFSAKHFRLKLLSGVVAAVLVIVFLAAAFAIFTWQSQEREMAQAHDATISRLGDEIANNLVELESLHRGALLAGGNDQGANFRNCLDELKGHFDLLASLLNNAERERRLDEARSLVLDWATKVALPAFAAPPPKLPLPVSQLGTAALDRARETLELIQSEAQIAIDARERDSDRAMQAGQALDTMPKLERAIVEMRKDARGFLLTSDPRLLDSYRRSLTDFFTYQGSLATLLASSPRQASLLNECRVTVERWINTVAAPVLDAKRSNRPMPSSALTKGDEVLSDALAMLTVLEKGAAAAFEAHKIAAAHDKVVQISLFGLLAAVAVLLLLGSNSYSFVLVRRQIAKLEGAESRIRSIIDSTLHGLITLDASGAITQMNPAAERMFGYRNQQMVSHKIGRLIPSSPCCGENDGNFLTWEDLSKRTGTTTVSIGCRRNQTSFPIEISLSRITAEKKQTYVAMIRDVTERKRFEHQLAAEKESLAVTLRSIGDGVITSDVTGHIQMINHAAEVLTGWRNEDAVGQPLPSVFNIQIDLAAQARARRNGYHNEAQSLLSSIPENATLLARDGTERLVEQVASPIRDNKNEVAGVVLVFRDITERERNESERRKAEALEQLGLLAGGIAHDFNNLLTAIMGNISLATLMLPPGGEMAGRLNDAKNASIRARDLAQQLLTFARGGAPIKKTASIGKLIQDTVSFSLRGSHSRGEFELSPNLWPAEIDLGQISQVIANLVVNADQAMPSGGTLHVTCRNFSYNQNSPEDVPDLAPGDYVQIAIRDEGIGIPENYLKRIFDPYFTTKPKGNGLGLATTYSIIKNHKGLITVESEVNMGTTFTIYLPAIAKRTTAKIEDPKPASEAPLTGTGRILVVDDEEAIRALVEFTLSHLGYEVHGAATAIEGVNLYREFLDRGQGFDLVILDLTLPGGMGGKEALRHLIELDPAVNAIVSSGYATDATMSQYQEFGFRGVIAKPYEAAELGRAVRESIGARSSLTRPASLASAS